MKKLSVYAYGSAFHYDELFKRHTYTFEVGKPLIVYLRDEVTGEESITAVFREWNYFLIEED